MTQVITMGCEVKWALGSIIMNKASGGDGIPVELFQILKDDAVKCCTQYASKFGKRSSGHRTRKCQFSFQSQRSSVQLLSHVRPFVTPWTAAHQASLSTINSWSLLKLISIESVMPSNHLILCCPLSSSPQSFPTSGSFPVSRLLASRAQGIGASASASVLPMAIQG